VAFTGCLPERIKSTFATQSTHQSNTTNPTQIIKIFKKITFTAV